MVLSRRGILVVLALAAVWAVALVYLFRDEPSSGRRLSPLTGSQLPSPLSRKPAPRIQLTDARGGRIDTADLRGDPYAITFLYTACPDVCPVIGQVIKSAIDNLGARGARLNVIAVSVDPRGDTPRAVRGWLTRQRLPRTFRYGVGTRAELAPVWKAYFATPQVAGRPETSTHSATVWLVDARGRLRTRHAAGDGFLREEDLTDDFDRLLDEAR